MKLTHQGSTVTESDIVGIAYEVAGEEEAFMRQMPNLIKFARLIANKEREDCLKLVDILHKAITTQITLGATRDR
jgi:hypothetical protein